MSGGAVILLLAFALTAWAIVEAFAADPNRVRGLPKTIWVIIILLFLVFGAIAWFIFGRPRGKKAMSRSPRSQSAGWGSGAGSQPRRNAPIAPDDDPEFLSRLREQMRQKPDDDA